MYQILKLQVDGAFYPEYFDTNPANFSFINFMKS